MEKQFIDIFKEFLLSKGYPENSLLFEFKSSKIHPKFRPDLLVIDTENDNFLCLFEFKSSTSEKSDLINEILIKRPSDLFDGWNVCLFFFDS